MDSQLVVKPHPFTFEGHEATIAPFLPRETLGAYIERNSIALPRSDFEVWHNGHRVPHALWDKLRPRTGDTIVIAAVPRGGGGGGGKILRTVAMVALVVVASWAAGAYGAALGSAIGTSAATGSALISAGIMIGGSLLINALLPPPKPTLGQLDKGRKYEVSPTYSLTGGRNGMRPWEPMTVVFGEHKVIPDLGANYFTEWVGNNQYLNQLFHFGLHDDDLELGNFRIGATPLEKFKDVQLEISKPNGKINLFPGSVEIIEGWVLESGVQTTRRTGDGVTNLAVEIAAQLYRIDDEGNFQNETVELRVQYRRVGTSTWTDISPEVPIPPGRRQEPTISPGVRMLGRRQEPTRTTVSVKVPAGEYEVRVWKVTGDIKESRRSNEVAVNQILAFHEDTADYTGQKRVGLRIRATSQLNGSIDSFSATAIARTMVWENGEWVFKATRNPAWSFLRFAMGKYINNELVYGAGLDEHQIDLDSIKEWAQWCDDNNLKFDWVLDRQMSVFDVLSTIARAGRASPTWKKGKLGVVWDAANLPAVAMFGPFNIKAGSFEVSYLNSNGIADEIIVNFANRSRDYQMDEVRVQVPGTTGHKNPLQLDLEGVTTASQAGREANLIAASQVWHRRRITWETDIEGWVASRGDVVQFSHDLTVWGYSGRVLARDGNELVLSQSIPDPNGIMMLRDPEGNMVMATVAGEGGETDTVTVISDLQDFPLPGDDGFEDCDPMDWAWFFDPEETPGRRFKIVDVQPAGTDGVRFEAIDDDPEYYLSENNPYQYTPPRDGALLAGKVLNLRASEGYVNTLTGIVPVTFSWSLSVPALVDVEVRVNGESRPTQRGMLNSIVVDGRADDEIVITVTPIVATGSGEARSFEYEVIAEPSAPTQVGAATAEIEGTMLRLRWPTNPEPDIVGYEVRASDNGWGGSNPLFKGSADTCTVAPGKPEVAKSWYIRAYNGAGLFSEVSRVVTHTLEALPNVTSIEEKFQDTSLTNATITLRWDGVEPQLGLEGYVVSYDDESEFTDSTTITLPADWIGNKTYMVCAKDKRGNLSSGTQKSIQKLLPNPPTDIRAQVIDNNVLLYWKKPEPTTLPFDHVLIKKGEDWENAVEMGTLGGEFTSFSELEGGEHTYWLAAVDTDGWQSEPIHTTVNVSEPPDFVFFGELNAEFTGDYDNAYLTDGRGVLLPVNTEETWQEHFTDNSWGSIDQQVSAGYPLYPQPAVISGSYTEVFDFGTTLASSRVSLSLSDRKIAQGAVVSTHISTSQDGSTWQRHTNTSDVYATNFRYVRIEVEAESDGKGLVLISGFTVRLSSKLKNDAGHVEALASDTNGTIANFNVTFLDVASITLTPAGTQQRSAVYDYKDVVYEGTYNFSGSTITVNVSNHGLLKGMAVRLSLPGRTPVVTTITSTSANSFTAQLEGSGSGNVEVYAQGMAIYLFDEAGQRVSGRVSWAARGS